MDEALASSTADGWLLGSGRWRLLRVGGNELQTKGRPLRLPVGVEDPHREVREHPSVDEDPVPPVRARCRDGLKKDRDAHAHPDGLGNLEIIGLQTEPVRLTREDDQFSIRYVRHDHLDTVPLTRVGLVRVLELAAGGWPIL